MSEEVPFKSIKITLSEDAIEKLAKLRQRGSFRSDSATIEECVRVIYDISSDLFIEIDSVLARNLKQMPLETQAELLKRIGIRIQRFGIITQRMQKALMVETNSSAGT